MKKYLYLLICTVVQLPFLTAQIKPAAATTATAAAPSSTAAATNPDNASAFLNSFDKQRELRTTLSNDQMRRDQYQRESLLTFRVVCF